MEISPNGAMLKAFEKSHLVSALKRLVRPEEGDISIDSPHPEQVDST